MSLQQLVDHFNDKFVQEQGGDVRPFILQDGAVTGLFGNRRINSEFVPIRDAYELNLIIGYSARDLISPSHTDLKTAFEQQSFNLSEIINFDRLCRTVHLLNYLAISQENSLLFLSVDPRHVMSIKHSHGAYFEEVIGLCGLKVNNIVISLIADGIHYQHHFDGLNNYRECGYKIALNAEHLISADRLLNLIKIIAPDYVRVTAPNQSSDSAITALHTLQKRVSSLGGRTVFQNVLHPEQAACAAQIGFDLVQGRYYEELSATEPAQHSVKSYSHAA